MRGLGNDLRHAVRLFTRGSPGFTVVAVLTLAVGIGSSTAMFGLLDALLRRGLPYAAADRLVVPRLTMAMEGQGPPQPLPVWSYPKYQTLLEHQDVFEDIGGYS